MAKVQFNTTPEIDLAIEQYRLKKQAAGEDRPNKATVIEEILAIGFIHWKEEALGNPIEKELDRQLSE